jgi:hypothetical protein
MSLPFERSVRALKSDREWPALAVLGSAAVLLALWAFWFFTAPIARYETAPVTGVTRDGAFVATFPGSALSSLRPGQMALLRWQAAGGASQGGAATASAASQVTPALVMLLDPSSTDSQVAVELVALAEQPFAAGLLVGEGADSTASIVAEVEVEYLSPAQWVLRASGQFIDTPQVLLRPQAR